MLVETVRPGDSVYSIARRYGVAPEQVLRDNQIGAADTLIPGQTLVLPVDYETYRVSPGQSLYRIANSLGISVEQPLQLTPHITDPGPIAA